MSDSTENSIETGVDETQIMDAINPIENTESEIPTTKRTREKRPITELKKAQL